MLDRWLLPGAVVLAAIVLALTFRVDVQTAGSMVVLYDRFDGSLSVCPALTAEQCKP